MKQGDIDHDTEASLASLPPVSGTWYGTPTVAVRCGILTAAVLTRSSSELTLRSIALYGLSTRRRRDRRLSREKYISFTCGTSCRAEKHTLRRSTEHLLSPGEREFLRF